jgi:hypothetical protein
LMLLKKMLELEIIQRWFLFIVYPCKGLESYSCIVWFFSVSKYANTKSEMDSVISKAPNVLYILTT